MSGFRLSNLSRIDTHVPFLCSLVLWGPSRLVMALSFYPGTKCIDRLGWPQHPPRLCFFGTSSLRSQQLFRHLTSQKTRFEPMESCCVFFVLRFQDGCQLNWGMYAMTRSS
ncbi:hypothetical protein BKA70DRAFT_1272436 [Coprinopsis sp. MPI-PUGE-AT-0042]|nr:hypothetical protein BKA70DRAFT_1272436 [Coprinopsis sp. MPI-PUGE-AT-0042]